MRKHTAAPVHQEARVLGESDHFLFLSVPTDDSLGDSALVVLLLIQRSCRKSGKSSLWGKWWLKTSRSVQSADETWWGIGSWCFPQGNVYYWVLDLRCSGSVITNRNIWINSGLKWFSPCSTYHHIFPNWSLCFMSISIHVTSFSLDIDQNCQKNNNKKKLKESRTVICYAILGKIFHLPWFVEQGTKVSDFSGYSGAKVLRF